MLFPFSVSAQQEDAGDAIHDAIQEEHQKADVREKQVQSLNRKASQLSGRLSSIENRIGKLGSQIKAQEKVLDEIRQYEAAARKEHYVLEARRDKIFEELQGLLRALWPVHMQSVQARFAGVENWAMADRRFNWLADVYGATRDKFAEARTTADLLKRNLERQSLLEKEAEVQLAKINNSKDKLLRDKWTLRSNLKRVRTQKESLESELQEILATIKQLNYQLNSQKTKKFDYYKRSLPWPVDGDVIAGFNPGATPPRRGLSLSVIDDAEVRSIFWGKVVHNDTLRGFGRVVIIYHGYNYYSLYAYLGDTAVVTGQEVEKDEPIGKAGYYPLANGPGLYFELRFHQKPINPKLWLTSLN
ncbi:murein hydrolase activator EnvC family protein [Salidesulfovibrio onnuriiensis]|uniref:murein hydrolase activator EnvC family protein n=1 Tax=Salidesulfovibrio onnuriiensis TaxID=2583823 RepID=UPI00202AF683|nr:peptidoglycan DD-metalloendopeptidase family protein [Salidesulfovibrio onnuriiensis]